MFESLRNIFKSKKQKAKDHWICEVGEDQIKADEARLIMHDLCVKYDMLQIDSMVHESWRQMCAAIENKMHRGYWK